jgi:hypothetical protein
VTVLRASDIGEYTFCPEAWYLHRHEAARSVVAKERLATGVQAHRRIGARTDRVRRIDMARRLLLAVMAILVVTLLARFLVAVGFA